MNWESQIFLFLSASLLRPLLLAAVAAVILAGGRIRHPASRHAVWTAVLIGLLLAPVVSVVAPHWSAPVLPAPRTSTAPPVILIAAPAVTPFPPSGEPIPVPTPTRAPVLLWIYFGGVLAMVAYRLMGWVLLRCIVRRSRPLYAPWLRESSDVTAPVVAGLWRVAVLLPPTWREWSGETRAAVLAHEFAHIRRRDPLVAFLAQCAKCVLWFHPLAWWLDRKLSELAELACDAAALERMPDPGEYARILLEFAGAVNRGRSRVALTGLAMAASSDMRKRIDHAFEYSAAGMKRLAHPRLVLALLGLPLVCLAATTELGHAPVSWQVPAAPVPHVQVPLIAQQVAPQAAAVPAPVSGPHFEKASIEIAGPPVSGELCWGGCGGPGSPYPESQNEITYRHFTLRKILLRAYGVKDSQLIGPSSINAIPYNVAATAPVGATKEQFQLMLQNLLLEQLHLQVHVEKKEFLTGYTLLVADGGPKLQPWEASPNLHESMRGEYVSIPVPDAQGVVHGMILEDIATSLPDFARALGNLLKVPVHDKTGVSGKYVIPYQNIFPGFIDRETYVAGILEPLGLRLEEERGLLDVITVDSFDVAPR